MQPRLTRNTTDKMVAGVCAGLGEYFSVDPVIVRLIFVLVTLSSGLGLPIYAVLWMIMPAQSAAPGGQNAQQGFQQFTQEASQFGQQVAQEAREFVVAQQRGGASPQPRVDAPPFAPPPADYRFDPVTGLPIGPEGPTTGQTVNLNMGQQQLPQTYQPNIPPPLPRRRNWNMLGIVLVGVGALIMLEQLGINMSLLFPLLLIAAGVVLIRRKR
jgi:phage shock protein C